MKRITLLALILAPPALAADHAEAPGTSDDPAADIADLYAWHDSGDLILALTFAGLQATPAPYDANVLYTFHLDTNADNISDHDIEVRFGADKEGAWGVQVTGLPGELEPTQGAIETTVTSEGGARVWAGLRDDPFFFDLEGFIDTLSTGTLSFDSSRDSLAGANVSAIVIATDAAAATGAEGTVSVWATTSRI